MELAETSPLKPKVTHLRVGQIGPLGHSIYQFEGQCHGLQRTYIDTGVVPALYSTAEGQSGNCEEQRERLVYKVSILVPSEVRSSPPVTICA